MKYTHIDLGILPFDYMRLEKIRFRQEIVRGLLALVKAGHNPYELGRDSMERVPNMGRKRAAEVYGFLHDKPTFLVEAKLTSGGSIFKRASGRDRLEDIHRELVKEAAWARIKKVVLVGEV